MKHVAPWITALLLFAAPARSPADTLRVVATTSILADVVKQVAGDAADVQTLMPPGSDPHHFEPSAREQASLSSAAILFVNGLGLESYLPQLRASLPASVRVVEVSEEHKAYRLKETEAACDPDHDHADHDHADHTFDPHVWTDPTMVAGWTKHIASALSKAQPANADHFDTNAKRYRDQLDALDQWITKTVAALPPERRLLATDHQMLGYFARRYGFEQVGMILPSFSSAAEPSARELATLSRALHDRDVPALFIGMSANSVTADRISDDAGIRVVRIHSGSLGLPGSGAETYLDSMKVNVRAIVDALSSAETSP